MKFLLTGMGLGLAIGATKGVALKDQMGNTLLAFLGALVGEAIWFAFTLGNRDLLEARYDIWPGLAVVTAGIVLPVVGAMETGRSFPALSVQESH